MSFVEISEAEMWSDGKKVANLDGVTWSTEHEKVPLRMIGSEEPFEYVEGKTRYSGSFKFSDLRDSQTPTPFDIKIKLRTGNSTTRVTFKNCFVENQTHFLDGSKTVYKFVAQEVIWNERKRREKKRIVPLALRL